VVVKIRGIVPGKYKGSKRYKLNYMYVNYNNKTGFCYKNTIRSFLSESCEKQNQKQEKENVKHWKCEKCNNLFSRFRQLKQHKVEYHAY
jgi:ribosomal protein L37AE/L43A